MRKARDPTRVRGSRTRRSCPATPRGTMLVLLGPEGAFLTWPLCFLRLVVFGGEPLFWVIGLGHGWPQNLATTSRTASATALLTAKAMASRTRKRQRV